MIWKQLFAFFIGKKKLRCLLVFILVLLYLCTAYMRLILPRMRRINQDNTQLLFEQTRSGFVQMSKNRLRWIRRTVSPDTEGNQGTLNHSVPQRKFIFAFRYYEQLGRATENLLALCSLAKYGDRVVVAPFVNNSRMAGIPYGVGHHFRKKRVVSFSPFQTYFDLQRVNDKLKSNGYSSLTTFESMAERCNRRLNVVVHFLHHERKSIEDAVSWYRMTERELQDIYLRARQNNGWTNCPYIRKSNIGRQLGEFKVSRYVCVDPEIIRTSEKFEEEVLQGANCVGIVQWKGIGPGRTHFALSRTFVLRPSDLQHNVQLIDLARRFIETSGLGKSFISVHVRAERHIFRRGINITRQCFKKLAGRVQKLKAKHNWRVYLSTDMVDHGSDTLIREVSKAKRLGLYLELKKMLGYPVTLSPIQGLYDTGAIAIIEMHILASGKKLVTLGGGNYQEWIVQLFSGNVQDLTHSLYRICEMR